MQEGQLSPRLKFGIFIAFLILLIGSAIYLIAQNRPQHSADVTENSAHVSIDNFSATAPNIPAFYQTETEAVIWKILYQYNHIPDTTFTTATIRQDSYHETDKSSDLTASDFLIDLPDLKHTFKINFNWQKNVTTPTEWNIEIACPAYTDVIYPDTLCFTSSDIFDGLRQYLPAQIDKPNLRLSAQTYNEYYGSRANKSYLAVDVITSCEKETSNLAAAEKYVNSWLEERYFNPLYIYIEYYSSCHEEPEL